MKTITRATAALWVSALTLGVGLSACSGAGSGNSTGATVSGVAVTSGATAATVFLNDSSAPSQQRTAEFAADGSYSVDVTGLTAPFLIKAEWTDGVNTSRLYSSSDKAGTANVNELTDLAFSRASGTREPDDSYERSDNEERKQTSHKITLVLTELRVVLAPLFDLYGVVSPLHDRSGLRALLHDVSFSLRQGVLTVTNRATGGVIFSGPIDDLSSGTFHPENLPAGVTPPPSGDGAALYGANCASCHGPLASSAVHGASASDIQEAIGENTGGMGSLKSLTSAQLLAIAGALSSSTPPPVNACTSFTYSAFGACQPSNTQTRTVLTQTPAGCTGGNPVLSQACVFVPPVNACTAFTYSAFGACQPSNTQTRTVLTQTPAGCTGGNPVLSQACVFTPPIDGAALYTQLCSNCHGNGKKGRPASAIQGAIDANVGGMGSAALRALTLAQVAAIAAAP